MSTETETGTAGSFERLEPPLDDELTLEHHLEELTPGMARWRVRHVDRDPLEYDVTLLGSTVSKMESLHHRKLTVEDVRLAIQRAVLRERRYYHRRRNREPGMEAPESLRVRIRDTDLAELDDSVTTLTNDVPP